MHRRLALTTLTRAAAAFALGSLFAPPRARAANEVPQWSRFPFQLGVASGMPRPDGVVLWTRLVPQPYEPLGGVPDAAVPVRWELAVDAHFRRVVRAGLVDALPQHAHSVHVEVSGLLPAETYFYRFIAGDAVSPIGRTRTAPAADAPVERLRLALASCQHYEQGFYAAHREIAARDLDLVLFVGDYLYESSNPRYVIRKHDGDVPKTLQDYRRRHATYKLDGDLQAAHAAHAWLLTWDDHEVENDYADGHSQRYTPPEQFLRQRAAAYKAYFEHQPVSPRMASDPSQGERMRIHQHYRWGQLADLWTLDNRQYRSQHACPDAQRGGGRVLTHCDALLDDQRSIWGEAQERWLYDGLRSSTRAWKIMAQGTQLSSTAIDTPMGRSVYTDGWDGYPKARERLLRTIAEHRVADTLSLGGDVHRHVAANLRLDPNNERSAVVTSEFITSSITSRGLPETAMATVRANNPDLLHARSDERGYALIEVSPQRVRCEFRATAFPVAVDARLHTQAVYAVERGQAGVAPAS